MPRFNYAELDEFIQYSKAAIIYAYFNSKKSEMEKHISSSTKLKYIVCCYFKIIEKWQLLASPLN